MTTHPIQRARERYGLELTTLDLKEIVELILAGKAKKIDYSKNVFGFPHDANCYRLRYKGKMIEPAIKEGTGGVIKIVTFYPCGKGHSFKKYLETKHDKDYLEKQKRLKHG